MKFGKDFKNHLEETLPDWRDKFLCYKPLKKFIKNLNLAPETDRIPQQNNDDDDGYAAAASHRPRRHLSLQDWFIKLLNEELEKFNDFYVDKEEEFVIRLQELKNRIERVRASKNEYFTSEREFSEEMLEIRKAFVTIHGEMVLLKNYSSLNFAGLVKILKKYDKRTGGLLSVHFTQRALHQPFFTTEPLTSLVRECEANLELLFPLEAEVIESGTAAARDERDDKSKTSAQEDSDDVYRSTLAAMKAINGLRKASSTCSPFSLAQFFNGEGENVDDSGAVTAENSDSNCPTALPENKETEQDSVRSVEQELVNGSHLPCV